MNGLKEYDQLKRVYTTTTIILAIGGRQEREPDQRHSNSMQTTRPIHQIKLIWQMAKKEWQKKTALTD